MHITIKGLHTHTHTHTHTQSTLKTQYDGTSMMVQWLKILLPMQGTWVRALVPEDPTCHRATKPVSHNYQACALEPMSPNYWSLRALEPVLCNKRSHHNEKPVHCSEEKPRLAATSKSPRAATKTQCSQKIKINKSKKRKKKKKQFNKLQNNYILEYKVR